ncbi:tyrosyl-tRNA synthetase [Anaeromyxobacter dehalogenans 2CP-1]|uniref:Tyrosine--tRNA ligase n=1 Tax=Anaeromyxobacter dehalogenans (strain ATCC BAA-258 / DSM 21875 / 2CP-1) TaxID=455488 RepID=SYY_ANAD2|nr:tyrosine--tRNA ligase [Anaeromyxobacter dehalogenans]B8JFS8.1 RecName: Full=Tyrosine--tRNA ligase; AltName: Full=Tyrosyl-tRNA synthetase; Short=TyrRS [Anaeromyxobacter dehalogenans 2CP-1]ACL64516.1 tyrosyl-tRNA synthetase [Anaeromyxobacter dehalogenans 2CP-1]
MQNLLEALVSRSLVHDQTPGLQARLAQGPITGYVGFDPTADSLHVGHLLAVMSLAWLQRCGGTPIIVVGGGTGMVGDPSGKRSERPVLSVEEIDRNVAAIRAQLERFVSFEGQNAARVRNNADWLRAIGLMEFLRDVGKHFTVNYMLAKDSVKGRMESGISFTEFSYQLIQAYDFWHLFRSEKCELQMGGSDQWGNITAGAELVSRKDGASVHGLTFPLLTTASGTKFGKTEGGAVWLDPARTSPYKFFQFWLNTDDRDVERLLKFFTFLSVEEIAALLAEQARDPGKRPAQRRLAEDVTARVHGPDVTRSVVEASRILFGGTDLRAASADVLEVLAGEIPSATVTGDELAALTVADLLVKVGLAASKGEVRRGVAGRGFSLNGAVLESGDAKVAAGDLLAGGYALLQKGKRNYALVKVR